MMLRTIIMVTVGEKRRTTRSAFAVCSVLYRGFDEKWQNNIKRGFVLRGEKEDELLIFASSSYDSNRQEK